MALNRIAVIKGWADSIYQEAFRVHTGVWDAEKEKDAALERAMLTARCLPGLFRDDIIELEQG